MTGHPNIRSQIWTVRSQICPDFAKSEICPESEIWIFLRYFNGLMDVMQIWQGLLPNLPPNLDFPNNYSDFSQISDLSLSTPKGVGGLPPQGGEVHHPPLGNLLGPKTGTENDQATSASTARHQAAVAFHHR